MEKLYLEFVQARADCDRALRINADILARMNRDLDKTSAAIRESAKSKLVLRGLYRRDRLVLPPRPPR